MKCESYCNTPASKRLSMFDTVSAGGMAAAIGTPQWMAPEVIKRGLNGGKKNSDDKHRQKALKWELADVWSVGCTVGMASFILSFLFPIFHFAPRGKL